RAAGRRIADRPRPQPGRIEPQPLVEKHEQTLRSTPDGVGADEQGPAAVPAVEVEQVAVVEGPDPPGVVRPAEKDFGAQPLHGVRDFPGGTVDEKVLRRAEERIPEVEEETGARILPPPETAAVHVSVLAGQRRGALPVVRETAAIQALALRPSPIRMAAVVREGRRAEHLPV